MRRHELWPHVLWPLFGLASVLLLLSGCASVIGIDSVSLLDDGGSDDANGAADEGADGRNVDAEASDGGDADGGCELGSFRCAELQPQGCSNDGEWHSVGAACEYVCDMGSCTGSCSPTTRQCGSMIAGQGSVETCDSTGEWSMATPCAGGYCAGAGLCGVCAPASKACTTATAYHVCDATGQWGTTTVSCGCGCLNGTCQGCPEAGSDAGAGDAAAE